MASTDTSNKSETHPVEGEIEGLKAQHPGDIKVIGHVGELAYMVDVKLPGVVIKFQLEGNCEIFVY